MFAIFGGVFLFFALGYILLTAAVFYHLYHYTLPGWNAAKIVIPIFLLLSVALFITAAYFFFITPWNQLSFTKY